MSTRSSGSSLRSRPNPMSPTALAYDTYSSRFQKKLDAQEVDMVRQLDQVSLQRAIATFCHRWHGAALFQLQPRI